MKCTSILFTALLLTVDCAQVSGGVITCSTSGNVLEGDSASVICHYHTDIRSNKEDFYVYRYPYDAEDPDIPAICAWEDDFLPCDILPGYELIVHNTTVTLNITYAQRAHAVTGKTGDVSTKTGKTTSEIHMHCHAQRHHVEGQPTTILCFVPEILNVSLITMERLDPSDQSKAEEIIRCSKVHDSCIVNIAGYKIRRNKNPLGGFRVIVALVDRLGTYVCTAGQDTTHSCEVEVYKGPQEATSESNSQLELDVQIASIVLLGVCVLIVTVVLVSSFRKRLRCRAQKDVESAGNKNNTHEIEMKETFEGNSSKLINTDNDQTQSDCE